MKMILAFGLFLYALSSHAQTPISCGTSGDKFYWCHVPPGNTDNPAPQCLPISTIFPKGHDPSDYSQHGGDHFATEAEISNGCIDPTAGGPPESINTWVCGAKLKENTDRYSGGNFFSVDYQDGYAKTFSSIQGQEVYESAPEYNPIVELTFSLGSENFNAKYGVDMCHSFTYPPDSTNTPSYEFIYDVTFPEDYSSESALMADFYLDCELKDNQGNVSIPLDSNIVVDVNRRFNLRARHFFPYYVNTCKLRTYYWEANHSRMRSQDVQFQVPINTFIDRLN